jgi:hypothetical protein
MSTTEDADRVAITVGWGRIESAKAAKVHMTTWQEGNSATVEIQSLDLAGPDIAYIGEASVEAVQDLTSTLLMTGVIDKVDVHDEVATVSIVGSHQELREIRLGQMVASSDVPAQEKIYAILRATGWPSTRMNLSGWNPGPSERFQVSIPVAGFMLTRTRDIAGVTFTTDNPCDDEFQETEVGVIFSGATAWATTSVEADTLFDAEVRGLEKIDLGVSTLRALGAYRFPTFKSRVRPFKRSQARARVRAIGVTYVVAETGRHWLRQVGKVEPTELLEVDFLVPEEIREFLDTSSDQMLDRSVREWRAAVDSGEDYERVAHLWRSIECYANHHSEGPLFSKEERETIRSALSTSGTWSEKQSERLVGIGSLLNDRPLLEKFKLALSADGIEVSSVALKQITGTRRLRNDLEHGSLLSEPEHRLVDSAIAVMNYVIVSVISV